MDIRLVTSAATRYPFNGRDYAMKIAAHPAFAFDVNREPGWTEMVRDILRKHVDPR